MKEIIVAAAVEELERLTTAVNEMLMNNGCGETVMNQIELAVEEIFVNIVQYSGITKDGTVAVRFALIENPPQIVVSFLDGGKIYNPLEEETPDLAVPLYKRNAGGLGIFLVKQYMDAVDYDYKGGRNRLTIRKRLG